MDFQDFADGLKHVFRQDPDIVLVGEMRDPETMSLALTLAETGHLVFATLHTNGAAQTVERIIDAFPGAQQQQIRLQLSMMLRGVISQLLLPGLKRKTHSSARSSHKHARNLQSNSRRTNRTIAKYDFHVKRRKNGRPGSGIAVAGQGKTTFPRHRAHSLP